MDARKKDVKLVYVMYLNWQDAWTFGGVFSSEDNAQAAIDKITAEIGPGACACYYDVVLNEEFIK